MSITDDETGYVSSEYDDWFSRGYLRGLDHGRFTPHPELAARIAASPRELDVRYRGEHLSVHVVDGTAYAVLWEEWFGEGASTWVRHASPAAAHAWVHQVAAQWLHNDSDRRPGGGYLQNWKHRRAVWVAERDTVHGRWHIAVGTFPGVTYASTETDDVAAGWAWIERTLTAAGFPADQWPAAMLRTRDEDLPAPEPEPEPLTGAGPADLPAPADPPSYWRRVWQTALLWWHAALAPLRRQTSKPQATTHRTH
ncbi:hypothetical protein [Streptomyces rubiginosohelvolus]|uniref:Uncharacterized protein n=1 Tax=Streptomyces rubiginosohelvolus TaxID=67362 RepID=A0ABQ3CDM2_9ACTN|nr:hypothetical protein [Streptomyces pluricolorescens]GGZ83762.1 hypothetical protein GCM10010328_67480 [Streptomyces pluricolorescens]